MSAPPKPPRCPHCGESILAARTHCAGSSCGWVRCGTCKAVIDGEGAHMHDSHGTPGSECREARR